MCATASGIKILESAGCGSEHFAHLLELAGNPLKDPLVDLAPLGIRGQAKNRRACAGIEIRIACADQVRRDAEPGWTTPLIFQLQILICFIRDFRIKPLSTATVN